MAKEFVIYTDESSKSGPRYSNFYGGALIRSMHIDGVRTTLSNAVAATGMTSELKWTNITDSVSDRYCDVLNTFFDLVQSDQIKVRIMFTQNRYRPAGLTQEHVRNTYWILYYLFLKHAFGLEYCDECGEHIKIRLLLDQMPGSTSQVSDFKQFIVRLNQQTAIQATSIRFCPEMIAEIDSSQHVISQCLDIVLGSMYFRLNNLHRAIPEGKRRRGRRTLAKERVYKCIQTKLVALRPFFNIGESTGVDNEISNRWRHSYRHWKFVPSEIKSK